MKKLVYAALVTGLMTCISSCEKEAVNPGDFTLKPELKVTGVTDVFGTTYPANVIRSIDTTYQYSYRKSDTLKDNSGKYVLGADGKYQIKWDTIYYNGKTAKYYELEKIMLEAFKDTVLIDVESNAKWRAPIPSAGGKLAWYITENSAGGGDSRIRANVARNRSFLRTVEAVQYIYTQDSTVMYKLVFGQKGEKDK